MIQKKELPLMGIVYLLFYCIIRIPPTDIKTRLCFTNLCKYFANSPPKFIYRPINAVHTLKLNKHI